MIYGFRFNNIHSRDRYIKAIVARRPMIPESKDIYVEIPQRNGSYLIPDDTLSDFTVEVDCVFEVPENSTFMQCVREISEWLKTPTRRALIFDDDQGYFYPAKQFGSITPENIGNRNKTGRFTIQFRCGPQEDLLNG